MSHETAEDFARAKAQEEFYALVHTQAISTKLEIIDNELHIGTVATWNKILTEFITNYIDEGKVKKHLGV